jgi:DNA replication protein DnaC
MEKIKTDLEGLKLPGMASCLKALEETRRVHELSFTDGLKLLLQAEQDYREEKRYARLLKNATFRYRASIEELSFDRARGLEQSAVMGLASGNFIRNGDSVLITGQTGCGKSFLASSLGTQACRLGFSVAYHNTQKLMVKIKYARLDGSIIRFFEKLAKTELLILDDFGLAAMDNQQQLDLLEIIEDRHTAKATIMVSQLPVDKWFDIFPEETIADSILDRIVHSSYRFELKGESLRKKK